MPFQSRFRWLRLVVVATGALVLTPAHATLVAQSQAHEQGSAEGLVYDLKHPDSVRRQAAARQLGFLKYRAATPDLVAMAHDPVDLVRREVEMALEPVALDEGRQLTVYRMVQESLTNIGKYAQASEATIVMKNYESHVIVEVADNGKGFDTQRMRPSTHGLAVSVVSESPTSKGVAIRNVAAAEPVTMRRRMRR